jgi:glycerol-3-phosphate acyltransferase PlsY
MVSTIISCVIAYLIGSLSSAIFICKLFKLPDPRTVGSSNPGATNVLRIGGKIPALLTLFGDMLKGFIPVLISNKIIGITGLPLGIIAIFTLLGHIYPIFFRFRGGKGVATAAGAVLALSPSAGIAAIISWVSIVIFFRYSSLAAIITALLSPIFVLLFADSIYLLPTLVIALILLWRHKENILRLKKGAENKIKFK